MHMGLKKKLIFIVIAVGAIPLILAMIISYHQGNKSLMKVIGSSFKALAFETSTKIDLLMKEEILKIARIARHPTLILSVTENNKFLEKVPLSEIGQELREQTLAWENQDLQDASPANNRASRVLKDFLKNDPYASENTLALFVTDSKGVLISSFNFYPGFLNTELPSWKGIMTEKLETFIGPLLRDRRTERYLFEFAVPVKDHEGQKVGVLHRIYAVKDFFDHALDPITFGETGHVMLINSDGVVLTCPILPTGHQLAPLELVKAVTGPSAAWAQTLGDGHGSEDVSIIGYSPLEQTSRHTLASINHRWFTFAWQASDELFAPTRSLLTWVAGAGVFSILLIVIMGSLAADKIVQPIRQLQQAAASIGRGEKVAPLKIKTGDEIESLSEEINTMSKLLQRTFSGLEEQVEAKTQEVLYLKKYTESILMSVPEVVVIFDTDLKIEYANAAFETLSGSKPAIYLGQRLGGVSLESPAAWNQMAVELGTYQSGKRSSNASLDPAQYAPKDPLNPSQAEPSMDTRATVALRDQVFAYQFFDVMLENEDARRIGLIMKDITEQKDLLDQLTRAEKLSGLGTLAAGIAHEMNNPLYSVMAHTEAIMEQENISKIRELAGKVLARSKHMASVILNLSGYARANDKDAMMEVDINERLDAATEMALMASYSDDIELVKNYESASHITAKPEEIQQVFLNIISNSVQAMDGKGTINLSTQKKEGFILVQIRDTGPGIPREHLSKVFDPFFTTREVGKGTGLGLNIVHRVVEKYGGNIQIESEVGQGTTVMISLPTSGKKGSVAAERAIPAPGPSV